MLAPNGSSERLYYVFSQWIVTGPSDFIEQGGDPQPSCAAVDAREFIFNLSVRILQLEDEFISGGNIGREVAIAPVDSCDVQIG